MADRQQIYEAIRRADQAGDRAAVERLGRYLKEMDTPKNRPTSFLQGFAEEVTPYAANAVRVLNKTNPVLSIIDAISGAPRKATDRTEQQITRGLARTGYRGSTAGKIAGSVVGSLPTMAMPGGVAAQGAAAGLLGSRDRSPRALAQNAAMGAVAAKLGDTAIRGVARAISPNVAPVIQRLQSRGIPLTPGQIAGANGGLVGRGVRAAENKMTSVPGMGDAIVNAQQRGIEGFNRAAFNEALSPIGQTVDNVAEPGVEMAKKAVSDAYTRALAGRSINPDQQFADDLVRAVSSGQNAGTYADDFARIMQDELQPALAAQPGAISGENMQNALRIAGGYGRQYGKLATTGANGIPQPSAKPVADAFNDMNAGLEGLIARQDPEMLAAYNAAKEAYRNTGVVRDAVNAAKVGGAGQFTPAQLSQAARANAKKFGGTHGTTNQPFFDLTRDAQDVLPNTIPNSGTADRGMLGMLIGGTVGLPAVVASGIGSIPYTKGGQKAAEWLLTGRQGPTSKAAARALERLSRGSGLLGAPFLLGGS